MNSDTMKDPRGYKLATSRLQWQHVATQLCSRVAIDYPRRRLDGLLERAEAKER